MNKQKDLISVVVPVYNVEEYLARCIKSILNQTYRNLQIILADDGSTDSSGEICDTFKSDKRVEVIHKKNGGLSSARNAALPYIKGKYVTFIDSDDWVDLDFIQTLYSNAIKYNSEISAGGYYIALDNGKTTSYFGKDNSCKIMDSEEALGSFLLHDGMGVTVWGKLYKTTLWNNVRCPEGKLHEDQYTTYKLLDLANVIVFDKQPLYYYYRRDNSIGHSKFTERSYDLYNGIHEEYNFISKKYPNILDKAKIERDVWELVFVNMMIRSNVYAEDIICDVKKHVKKDMKLIMHSNHLNNIRKLEMWLFSHNFKIYKCVYLKYKNN